MGLGELWGVVRAEGSAQEHLGTLRAQWHRGSREQPFSQSLLPSSGQAKGPALLSSTSFGTGSSSCGLLDGHVPGSY